MKKAVTIQSIAKELNISRNTVSKALNGQYVPKKTRDLVLAKAKELNYKSLNLVSDNIKSNYRILLVSPKPLNDISFYVSLISEIQKYCFEKNYVFLQYIFNKKNSYSTLNDDIRELKPNGIIALECFDKLLISKLLKLEIPICFHDFIHTPLFSTYKYDIICTNDEQSISNYVKELHKSYKLTRFCFVGDNKHCHSFRKRYTGMLLGLRGSKISHSNNEDINISENILDYGNPIAIKQEIESLNDFPEVYICCNDFVARTVCQALMLLNVSIPSQALVVGFDNASESISSTPTLTTFSLDKHFLASEIMGVLVTRIKNKDIPSRFMTISTDKITRESTNK